jgi:acyl-CoA synthetase (AMP-forming)/AMP-acid ligase II
MFSSLVDLLCYRSQNQPSKTAFIFLSDGETETHALTYQALDRQARAIAHHLQSVANQGNRVLLLYPPGLEFISAFFGCLYAGMIAVPASLPRPNRPASRLLSLVSDTQATAILTTASLLDRTEKNQVENPCLQGLHLLATDRISINLAANWHPPDAEDSTLALLQYTSGSTGTPKGVMVAHRNILHNSELIQKCSELMQDSVSLTWLPSFHDMGLIDGLIQPIYSGFLGILMPPAYFVQKPIRWLAAITRFKATHSGGPNFAYDLCVQKIAPDQREQLDLSSWYSAYNGSEPIQKRTLDRFAEAFSSAGFQSRFFYPCYGMAESTLMIAGGLVKDEIRCCAVDAEALEKNNVLEASETTKSVKHLVGCGRPWLDTEIAIVNPETLTRCPSDRAGEIWVSGSSVAQGYWNRPEESQKTFAAYLEDTQEGPFLRTGDLGFWHEGDLFVTGRIKDMVIIRGQNYYPQDIEQTVSNSYPAFTLGSCAAFAVEADGTEKLAVIQEVKRSALRSLDATAAIDAVLEAVMQHHGLSIYATLLVKPGNVPKTSSGKVKRQTCRDFFLASSLEVVAEKVDRSSHLHC